MFEASVSSAYNLFICFHKNIKGVKGVLNIYNYAI